MFQIDFKKPVLVAGEVEKANFKEAQISGIIYYNDNQLDIYKELAESLNVMPIKSYCETRFSK